MNRINQQVNPTSAFQRKLNQFPTCSCKNRAPSREFSMQAAAVLLLPK